MTLTPEIARHIVQKELNRLKGVNVIYEEKGTLRLIRAIQEMKRKEKSK